MKSAGLFVLLFVAISVGSAVTAQAQCYLSVDPTLCDPIDPGVCDPTIDPTCSPTYCDPNVTSCDVESLATRNGCLPGQGVPWIRCQWDCKDRLDDAYNDCTWIPILRGYCRAQALKEYQTCLFNCDVQCQS